MFYRTRKAAYSLLYIELKTGSDFCERFGDGTKPGKGVFGTPGDRFCSRKSAVRKPKSEQTVRKVMSVSLSVSVTTAEVARRTKNASHNAGEPNEELDERSRAFADRQRDGLDVILEEDAWRWKKVLVSFGCAPRSRKRSAAWRTGDAAAVLCGATHLCHRVLVRVEHSSRRVYVGRRHHAEEVLEDVESWKGDRRQLGVTPQEASPFPHEPV